MEPAFEQAGQKPGLEIWRIEDFRPVPYPEKDYGKFYTGDSYVVLFTKERNNILSWNIHFWLGLQTTQDEAGAAAILTVQLDEQLGGTPVQYREVQEHESQAFLSLFKSGVRYLPGGVASGFTHVDRDVHDKLLYHVKGKKNIRVKQVDVTAASMNQGDCFILDTGDEIFVYIGSQSKRSERLKAIHAANAIRDQDHGGRPKIEIIDDFSSGSDFDRFFEALGGGSKDDVPKAKDDDEQYEKSEAKATKLYRVCDSSGTITYEAINETPLLEAMLDSKDCFILFGGTQLYVWVGKASTQQEKSASMSKANVFLKENNLPEWTHIQRVVEGAEPAGFQQYFSEECYNVGPIEPVLYHGVLIANKDDIRLEEMSHYSQGDLDEDDIMMLYTGSQLFVWIGSGADENERKLTSKMAEKLLKKHNRKGTDVITIEQGKEPESFTALFHQWSPDFWKNKD